MTVDPGQAQSYGVPYANTAEKRALELLRGGGYLGGMYPSPVSGPGQVYLGNRFRVPLDQGLMNVPGARQSYQMSNMVTLDKGQSLFYDFSPDEMQFINVQASRALQYNVGERNPPELQNFWNRKLEEFAKYQDETKDYDTDVFEFIRNQNDKLEAAGFIKPFDQIGGGAGGGYRGPVTAFDKDVVIDITNPSEVKLLLDRTLQDYLGRDATNEERATFMDTLNRLQREQPQVTESVTKISPSGRPTQRRSSTTERMAGVRPEVIAEEFARSRGEAAEQRMSGQFMDWFMEKLMAPAETEMIKSGL